MKTRVVFPFPAVSSKSERVFSVSHPKGRPEPREGEGQSLKLWVGGGQESQTLEEVLDLYVYIAFWITLSIIFFNIFGEKINLFS